MEVRDVNCFVLCKEIEEVKGWRYFIRRCRLIYDETRSFPLVVHDEVGAVPRSLDELGVTLPFDLADRVWEKPETEWGDLRHVQDCFRRYERLFTERCAQLNTEEMLCAFEAAQEHAAFLKRSPMGDDDRQYQIYLDNVVRKFKAWFRDYRIALPEMIRVAAASPGHPEPVLEQATQRDMFQAELVARGLKKGKTVPREVLFEIAKQVRLKGVTSLEQFKSGDSGYHLARKTASDLGFRKLPRGISQQENY